MTRPTPFRRPRRLLALAVLALAALLSPAAARAQASGPPGDDAKTLAEYRLTDATLARFVAATRALASASEAHPEMSAQIEREAAGTPTIAGIAAVYDRHAPLRDAFAGAGISSREYVTFMLSMMQAGLGAVLVKQNPANLAHLPGIPRENVEFYQRNEAALTRLGEEIGAMRRGPGSGS